MIFLIPLVLIIVGVLEGWAFAFWGGLALLVLGLLLVISPLLASVYIVQKVFGPAFGRLSKYIDERPGLYHFLVGYGKRK